MMWVAFAVFLLGMAKGGFPVGTVALPIMILVWPDRSSSAREAIAFMLPALCVMDIFAVAFYRKHIEWRRIRRLIPGTLAGVVMGSVLFVSTDNALLQVSDRMLKLLIGLLGLSFVVWNIIKSRATPRLRQGKEPGWPQSSMLGVGCGITSTLAHAAGPLMQVYLLPQRLGKLEFAGTTAGFFLILNAVKLMPFATMGRLDRDKLMLLVPMLPVIPLGVLLGYVLVSVLKPQHYRMFIFTVLFGTSILLIIRTFAE